MTDRTPSPRRIRSNAGLHVVEADPRRDQPVDRQPALEVERRVAREIDRGHRRAVVRADDPARRRRRTGRPRTTPARRTASSRRAAPCRRSAGSGSRSRSSTAARSPRRRRRGRRRCVPDRVDRRVGVVARQRPYPSPRPRAPGRASPRPDRPRRSRPAPASAAPMTADSPTPPSPITATLEPGSTGSVFVTAPTPVATQHPISAATSGGVPSGIGIAAAAGTTWDAPSSRSRSTSGRRRHWRPVASATSRPASGGCTTATPGTPRPGRRRHDRQRPHGTSHDSATSRPSPAPRAAVDPWPERLDDSRPLVAHHDRSRPLPLAVADVEVRVADARRGHPDAHLAGPRLVERQLLDAWLARAVEDGGTNREGGHRREHTGRRPLLAALTPVRPTGANGPHRRPHAPKPRRRATLRAVQLRFLPFRRGLPGRPKVREWGWTTGSSVEGSGDGSSSARGHGRVLLVAGQAGSALAAATAAKERPGRPPGAHPEGPAPRSRQRQGRQASSSSSRRRPTSAAPPSQGPRRARPVRPRRADGDRPASRRPPPRRSRTSGRQGEELLARPTSCSSAAPRSSPRRSRSSGRRRGPRREDLSARQAGPDQGRVLAAARRPRVGRREDRRRRGLGRGHPRPGLVVASVDTGVDFTHPALVNNYRGNNHDGTFTHDYNWWDPSGLCPGEPCDNVGHGTHTMGTMVGGDGPGPFTPDIGVAPGASGSRPRAARTSAAPRSRSCRPASSSSPRPTSNGNNPDPSMRPDIVNNSWGSGPGRHVLPGDGPGVARGRDHPGLLVRQPRPGLRQGGSPGNFNEVFSLGATDIDDNIADFSGRGPSVSGKVNPDVSAPGVDVVSSVPGGGYEAFSGTSMATPHVAGTIALMLSAKPALLGDSTLRAVTDALRSTAVDRSTITCGGDADGDPNYVYGEGRIDAKAAVDLVKTGGTLSGHRHRRRRRRPDRRRPVTANNGDRDFDAVTDASGDYSIFLAAGTYGVTGEAFGYAPAIAPASSSQTDATTDLDFALDALPRFTCHRPRPASEDGSPIEGASRPRHRHARPAGDDRRRRAPTTSSCRSGLHAAGVGRRLHRGRDGRRDPRRRRHRPGLLPVPQARRLRPRLPGDRRSTGSTRPARRRSTATSSPGRLRLPFDFEFYGATLLRRSSCPTTAT